MGSTISVSSISVWVWSVTPFPLHKTSFLYTHLIIPHTLRPHALSNETRNYLLILKQSISPPSRTVRVPFRLRPVTLSVVTQPLHSSHPPTTSSDLVPTLLGTSGGKVR